MKKLAMTSAAVVISASGAFAEEVNVSVDKIGDGLPDSLSDSLLGKPDTGVYRVVFEGQNTNGEDLECIQVVMNGGYAGYTGLSCNWTAPNPQ